MSHQKRVLSLFSGCGGMDIGFEGDFYCLKESINTKIHNDWIKEEKEQWVKLKPTGFKTVFANDIRKYAKAAWVSFFEPRIKNANEIYHLESIVNLVKQHKNNNNVFPNDIDIVTGGFPCQDFSVAGKRQGFKSTKSHNGEMLDDDSLKYENRGQLYTWMKEVISIVKPKVFIAENVKGLISLSDAQKIIEQDFANATDGGYLVVPARILQAANYGVAQSRERIIFYGFKRSSLTDKALIELNKKEIDPKYDPYPIATHNYNVVGENLLPFVDVRTCLKGLKEPNDTSDETQKKYSKAKLTKGQGNIEVKLDGISPTIRSEHHGNIEFRRLSIENGGKNIDEINAGMEQRRLTIRECARLQTFPDDYQFILPKTQNNIAVSASAAYKIIGNAVPCVLAYHIAKTLSEKWDMYFKKEAD
ncbi:DNA (cytosine-5-)-methyltransferase [Mycoplasma sp. NEAQ87857]|uniref:DNA cytosine methyltransferase n=1 Tax=Mycoplasma sp. NEAQ87857 TaxID=2683967 RepID=UPI00131982C5|nr:DNA (cytosine-5-)-methyltransferase [Mycoplasma sp. NEAQ87857]QGZ97729.1 DNA (cytosine-5-)-methyltransferase [Mycoplasma sp. NEAQ87857]